MLSFLHLSRNGPYVNGINDIFNEKLMVEMISLRKYGWTIKKKNVAKYYDDIYRDLSQYWTTFIFLEIIHDTFAYLKFIMIRWTIEEIPRSEIIRGFAPTLLTYSYNLYWFIRETIKSKEYNSVIWIWFKEISSRWTYRKLLVFFKYSHFKKTMVKSQNF